MSRKKTQPAGWELKHHGATSAGATSHASLALDPLSSPEANEEEEQIHPPHIHKANNLHSAPNLVGAPNKYGLQLELLYRSHQDLKLQLGLQI